MGPFPPSYEGRYGRRVCFSPDLRTPPFPTRVFCDQGIPLPFSPFCLDVLGGTSHLVSSGDGGQMCWAWYTKTRSGGNEGRGHQTEFWRPGCGN